MWEQTSNRQTDRPAERHFPICIQQMHLFWKMPSQGSAGGSGSVFQLLEKPLEDHSRAAHTESGITLLGWQLPQGFLCPHTLSPLPAPSHCSISPFHVPALCPCPVSQLRVPTLCPNRMCLPCIPVPCPCPVSLSHVLVLQTLGTQASYCRAEDRFVSHSVCHPGQCRAVPCRGHTDHRQAVGAGWKILRWSQTRAGTAGKDPGANLHANVLLIKDKKRNEQKPPSTRAEAFSPDAFQSC